MATSPKNVKYNQNTGKLTFPGQLTDIPSPLNKSRKMKHGKRHTVVTPPISPSVGQPIGLLLTLTKAL